MNLQQFLLKMEKQFILPGNNEKSGNFSRDKEGVSRLKIYRAQFS